jgi:hypothetical protein
MLIPFLKELNDAEFMCPDCVPALATERTHAGSGVQLQSCMITH